MTRTRLVIGAVILILIVAIIGEARTRSAQRRHDESAGRYKARLEALEQREAAVNVLLPEAQKREAALVDQLVASQAREKGLRSQLDAARRATTMAGDRAKALEKAPLADVLRAGEELGIKARVR